MNIETDFAEITVDFKKAMRRLAATITIITASQEGERCGMVATAVSSLSADPPSLVICVNESASVWEPIQKTRHFAVNLLSTVQSELVFPFSGKLKGEERFQLGEWHDHETATPYLRDAVATLFCEVADQLHFASHTVFVGAVRGVRLSEGTEPLLWKDGGFAGAIPLDKLLD